MQKLKFLQLIIAALMLVSCANDPLDVDVSGVNAKEIKVLRLDRDLFSMDTSKISTYTIEMNKKYGSFYSTFILGILNQGDVHDSAYKAVSFFISDKDMKEVHSEVQKIYTDAEMEKLENELSIAFKYYKYHFPKRPLPKNVVSFISGFNYNVPTTDSTLGIGLDMHLGADNKFYTMLQWPKYRSNQLSKEYIVPDATESWLLHEFDTNEPINNLLTYMIFYGKIYYCMDAMLLQTSDSLKIGYTTQQMDYCKTYEKKLWGHFTEKERLYKNDLKLIAEYTSDGPFTSAISKECPPRIASYIGWQIVRSYMKKNPDISLEELMKNKDYNTILSKSKYKP